MSQPSRMSVITLHGSMPGVTVASSEGFADRAHSLGERIAAARRYLVGQFDRSLDVRLSVLDEADWRAHCPFPSYGMPFSQPPDRLYAAAADNPVWRAAVPDPSTLPPAVAEHLRAVYGEGVGAGRFFDLLVVHELAHLFVHRGRLSFPRLWLRELFCNLAVHAYVETLEPDELPALEALPQVVASIPAEQVPHHTLPEWESLFEGVGSMAFAWYQCRLHRAAARIFRSAGPDSLRTMWSYFMDGPGAGIDADVPDGTLLRCLADLPDEVGATLRAWPS